MNREERKTSILQACSKVFYLHGFEKTKIEDVAKEAGIGKGTVYEYFVSKQQLFDEMVIYNRDLYLRSIERITAEGKTFREKFLALTKYQTKLVKDHINIFNSISCSKVMAREMGATILEQNIRAEEILKRLVSEAMERGELRADIDPEIAAAVMMGTLHQYCGKKVMFFGAELDDINYEKVVDTVIRGIGNCGASSQ